MVINLAQYRNLNICVAVSGGRDSMALLHYLLNRGKEYGISVCAVNFDHGMRGESSAKDSAFVAQYCAENAVPLLFFKWQTDGAKTETAARRWRQERYAEAVIPRVLQNGEKWGGADAVATAHHMNDNAETVLFNLCRGSGLSGLTGIGDEKFSVCGAKPFKLIRPLAGCSRAEIDEYIKQNGIPFVDDETNFTDDYTRNKIRNRVLPELENAVPGAAKAIYRFSRIAAEDEEFFANLISERGLLEMTDFGCEIAFCAEKPLFNRAALAFLNKTGVRDYTSEWLERLYGLQFAPKGKKFVFAGFTAVKEEGKIVIFRCDGVEFPCEQISFSAYTGEGLGDFNGSPLYFRIGGNLDGGDSGFGIARPKILLFDPEKIPRSAVIRFMRRGDRFKKFGGGTKSLGDFYTDKKIPPRLRAHIPVVADGGEILIVCGVEISDAVKVSGSTLKTAVCAARDYLGAEK